MDDNQELINALVGHPVMPETYDRSRGKLVDPTVFDPMPYLRAFGAGVVDPAGIPSTLMNEALKSDPKGGALRPGAQDEYLKNVERMRGFADWYMRRMQELRGESPAASGVGSAVLPALLAGPLVGGPALGAGSLAESMTVVPPVLGIGGAVGKVNSVLSPAPKPRPQGAYPTGGAY